MPMDQDAIEQLLKKQAANQRKVTTEINKATIASMVDVEPAARAPSSPTAPVTPSPAQPKG